MSCDASDTTVGIVDAEVVEERPRPWGLWATLGWSLMTVALYFIVRNKDLQKALEAIHSTFFSTPLSGRDTRE